MFTLAEVWNSGGAEYESKGSFPGGDVRGTPPPGPVEIPPVGPGWDAHGTSPPRPVEIPPVGPNFSGIRVEAETPDGEASRLDTIATKIEGLSVSQSIFRSDLEELKRDATEAGEAGRALLDALSPRNAGTGERIDLPPASCAGFARALGALLRESEELYVQSEVQVANLQKQISNVEFKLSALESEQLRAKNPAIQAGEITIMATIAVGTTAISAAAFEKKVLEEMATTVLEVAGGGGLFLIGRMCFRMIRSNSEGASKTRTTEQSLATNLPEKPPPLSGGLETAEDTSRKISLEGPPEGFSKSLGI